MGPTQAAFWSGLGVGRTHRSPGWPLAPLWAPSVLREASGALILIYFSRHFSGFEKLGESPCKIDIRRQKLALSALS